MRIALFVCCVLALLGCSQLFKFNLSLTYFDLYSLKKSCGQQFYHMILFCNYRKSYLEISGPGCSSLGGAMLEIGPFFVNRDNKTLSRNKYAWNNGRLIPTRLHMAVNTIYTSVLSADRSLLDDSGKHALP